ncbi:NUDIX hydrolase [Arthrobacter woluwensis]|uniref:NUDIX hydrolase n=1 Tax=Arthrobacter woluwensis TaxID=156980 RepID=UPI001FD2983C|nr:NUDIX domain-containing protein [Arthrobacter woluwensis]
MGAPRVVRKAVAYVVHRERLLVFTHDDVSIEVTGVQVPAGTVEAGESPVEAAVREVLEETGLRTRIVQELGVEQYDVRPAKDEVHERHFFQLAPVEDSVSERWQAGEENPSGGDPQRWTCWWTPLSQGHVLCAGFGALLGQVRAEPQAAVPEDPESEDRAPADSSTGSAEALLRPLSVEDAADVQEAFRSNPDMDRQGRVTTLMKGPQP